MRTEFHAQLDRLTAELGEMCGITASAAADATATVLHGDTAAAARVRRQLHHLDELQQQVDRRAFALLARHAPVAHDLRLVMTAFGIAADADRMGALAANIAGIGTRARSGVPVPARTFGLFADMGRHAVDLAERTQRAVVAGDMGEAVRVQEGDAALNELNRQLLGAVLNDQWAEGVAAATDMALLGRFYERFADQAVDIARKVVFQISGESPRLGQISH
ncbi:phosphate signaling complex protein PhoU [Mycobacterium sp. MBM]|nr:phosphate signaling complex protein PhoU [Mycobacterium sp. MBM]